MPSHAAGQIITFYSYKGGTGRSMALANVAYLLAQRSSPEAGGVLAIDWDLEAPGLHRYVTGFFGSSFPRATSPAARQAAFDDHAGLIDFFEEASALYERPSADTPPSDADPYRLVRTAALSRLMSFVLSSNVPKLSFLKAGRFDRQYAKRIQGFKWQSFYDRDPEFFRELRRMLIQQYEYVLIDSRTGLTDTSSICVRMMPEKLVLVFAPNSQNIDGVVDVARRVKEFRLGTTSNLQPLMMFPLACRIDSTREKLRDAWRYGREIGDETPAGYQPTFEALFREIYDLDAEEDCDLEEYFSTTQVHHDSDYAFGEHIAVIKPTTDPLSIGYKFSQLATRLTANSAPWEPLEEDAKIADVRRRERAAATREAAMLASTTTLKRWAGTLAAAVVILAVGLGALAYFKRVPEAPLAQVIFAAAAASPDPLEKALLLAELKDTPEPQGGLAITRDVAGSAVPLAVLRGHAGSVTDASFSPDGRRVVTASFDGIARIWNSDGTGDPLALKGSKGALWSAVFSPDGRLVVTAGADESMRLWDAVTGQLIHEYYSGEAVLAARFTPDMQQIVAVTTRNAAIWSLRTGKVMLLASRPDVLRAEIADDANRLLMIAATTVTVAPAQAISAKTVTVLDVPSKKAIAQFTEPEPITATAFSPAGRELLTSTRIGTTVWPLDGSREALSGLAPAPSPSGDEDRSANAMAISRDGRFLAIADRERAASVFSILPGGIRKGVTPQPVATLRGHRGPIRAIAFSARSSLVVTASGDATARIWDIGRKEASTSGDWRALVEKVSVATTACLAADKRRQLLSESPADARSKYETCERRHARTPQS